MNRRELGNTEVAVSELGLGTCFMRGRDQKGINECISQAVDRGIDYFDTAADYGKGKDERLLGEALRGRREKVFLATKVGCVEEEGGLRKADSLMRQFEGSLGRLQTDYVDLIQLHEGDQRKWWSGDPATKDIEMSHVGPLILDEEEYDFPASPCMEFLRIAKEQGKARFIGITGKDSRRLARLVSAVEFDSMMVAHQYNPIYRNASRFLLDLTESDGVGVVSGATFMKGWLAVPKTGWRDTLPDWMDEKFHRTYCKYLDIQASSGFELPEFTLRWLLPEKRIKSFVTGFKNWQEIKSNIDAVERGPLPSDLQSAVDAIGIVHPLLYQGRSTL